MLPGLEDRQHAVAAIGGEATRAAADRAHDRLGRLEQLERDVVAGGLHPREQVAMGVADVGEAADGRDPGSANGCTSWWMARGAGTESESTKTRISAVVLRIPAAIAARLPWFEPRSMHRTAPADSGSGREHLLPGVVARAVVDHDDLDAVDADSRCPCSVDRPAHRVALVERRHDDRYRRREAGVARRAVDRGEDEAGKDIARHHNGVNRGECAEAIAAEAMLYVPGDQAAQGEHAERRQRHASSAGDAFRAARPVVSNADRGQARRDRRVETRTMARKRGQRRRQSP